MSLKKKLSIIIPAVCAVVAIVLCVFLYREWTRPKIIEAPFEKLYWGMPLEEAEQVLKEAGIDKVMKASVSDPLRWDEEIWTLTIEQAELLGFKHIDGLDLSTLKHWPVHVGFRSSGKNGVTRLVTVSVVVEVDASNAVTSLEKAEYVRQQISKKFGDPINEHRISWMVTNDSDVRASTDPYLLMMQQAMGSKEMLLRYAGHTYVMSLYGGEWGDAATDRYM